jgi:hypothetical protein
MSNAFMGQRQQASPMGYGGYSGGYDPFGGGGYGGGYGGGMGGYGGGMGGFNPFGGGGYGGGMGGYGTQFGGYDMGGGGFGGFGGFGGGMRAPAYQPTINDAFSSYFSNQYYGGNAFNPFAATSMFGGGGYGGGFGGGGGGRRGGGARRRRQMFEDLFQPEQPPQPQPQPQPMPIGGGAYQPGVGNQRIEMGPVTPPRVPPATAAQLQQAGASSSGMGPGTWSQMTSNQRQKYLQDGGTAPGSPAAQGFDSIMPVQQQDTPVQSAPMFYEPPQMQPYAPSPFASPFSRPGRDMFTGSFGYGMR